MVSGYPTRLRITAPFTGLLVFLFLLTVTAGTAGAQLNTGAKLVVHLQPAGGSGPCPASSFSLGCNGNSSVVVNGDLNADYYALIVATNIDPAVGLTGAAFGIYYNFLEVSGLSVSTWTSCADVQVPGPDWRDALRSRPAGRLRPFGLRGAGRVHDLGPDQGHLSLSRATSTGDGAQEPGQSPETKEAGIPGAAIPGRRIW